MKKLIASLLIVVMLAGCSTLASKEATVICQTADTVSTIVAIKGGAVEANPVMAKIIAKAGFAGLIGFKVLLVYLILTYGDRLGETGLAAVNVATCAAAANNIGVISGQ